MSCESAVNYAVGNRNIDRNDYCANNALMGDNFILFLGIPSLQKLVPVATASANGLSINKAPVNIDNKTFGNWSASIGTTKTWSMSTTGILYKSDAGKYLGLDEIWEAVNYIGTVEARLVPQVFVGEDGALNYDDLPYWKGNVSVDSFDPSFDKGAGSQFSLTLNGVGALTMESVWESAPNFGYTLSNPSTSGFDVKFPVAVEKTGTGAIDETNFTVIDSSGADVVPSAIASNGNNSYTVSATLSTGVYHVMVKGVQSATVIGTGKKPVVSEFTKITVV